MTAGPVSGEPATRDAAAIPAAAPVAAALLEVDALTLSVGARQLLAGLSLRIERGERWCVLGPNGSGKTTLLHALAGLTTAGTPRRPAPPVRLAGRPIDGWTAGEAACLRGLLPQHLHDAFGASALDLVLLGRHPHLSRWRWEDEDDRRLAREALRAVDLEALADRDVTTLSGGERQRVGIAALLAQQPLLMLLDEPLAHLDLRHQVTVLEHLGAVAARGHAIVLTLHDLNLAHRFATHALVLRGDGGPAMHGPVDAVMTEATLQAAFGHPVRRARVDDRTVFVAA